MNPSSRFSLQDHNGPYESWPLKSRLLADGMPTPASLPGYSLLHQFETSEGYLLVTDWDCPFEEMTHFTLLNFTFRVLCSRRFGAPYASWLLQECHQIDGNSFEATFGENERWLIVIRSWGLSYVYPRIKLQKVCGAVLSDRR